MTETNSNAARVEPIVRHAGEGNSKKRWSVNWPAVFSFIYATIFLWLIVYSVMKMWSRDDARRDERASRQHGPE